MGADTGAPASFETHKARASPWIFCIVPTENRFRFSGRCRGKPPLPAARLPSDKQPAQGRLRVGARMPLEIDREKYMKLGLLTAPFPETPLDGVADWASSEGFEVLEI